MAPVAEVVEGKRGRPFPLMVSVVGAEVEAACADRASGPVILLETPDITSKRGTRAKMPRTTRPRQILGRSRSSTRPWPGRLISTAAMLLVLLIGRAALWQVMASPQKSSSFLLKNELDYFAKVVDASTKPVCGILGGAAVADKI